LPPQSPRFPPATPNFKKKQKGRKKKRFPSAALFIIIYTLAEASQFLEI
jgi:hypothetical protein